MSSEDEGYIDILIECPFCSAYVPDDYECLRCGTPIFEPEKRPIKYVCSRCGNEVKESEDKCLNCGSILT
ncbi:MAG: double zinc ribbon domain-containing protein [Thermoplasmatota archaeon]